MLWIVALGTHRIHVMSFGLLSILNRTIYCDHGKERLTDEDKRISRRGFAIMILKHWNLTPNLEFIRKLSLSDQ